MSFISRYCQLDSIEIDFLLLLANFPLFSHLLQAFSLEEHNMRILLLVAGKISIFFILLLLSVPQSLSWDFHFKPSTWDVYIPKLLEVVSYPGFLSSEKFKQLIILITPFSRTEEKLTWVERLQLLVGMNIAYSVSLWSWRHMFNEVLTLISIVWVCFRLFYPDKNTTLG